ncbi:MAG: leucine-rich repeat protein, partial [Paludibacteraceae bacterium]|nr:leucine-rich repeat protein [Paludibacteraceae bacterium]
MKRFATILLLFFSVFTHLWALTVKVHKVTYELYTSIDGSKEARVVSGSVKPSGSVLIESYLWYDNVNYKVVSIADDAFSGCADMTYVSIPITVSTIGAGAFRGCTGLTGLASYAQTPPVFTGDPLFPDYSIPMCYWSTHAAYDSAPYWSRFAHTTPATRTVGNSAYCFFNGLDSTLVIAGQGSVTTQYVRNYTNGQTQNVKQVIIEEGITSLCQYALYGPTTSVPGAGYMGYMPIKVMYVPKSLTSIGDYAFSYWNNCEVIEVHPDNPTFYSSGNCLIDRKLRTVRFGCMHSVVPDGVTNIGEDAFAGCYYLPSVTLPQSVTTLSRWAFQYCASLDHVTLGKNVSAVWPRSFGGCTGLKYVVCESATPPSIKGNASSDSYFSNYNIPLYVPKGTKSRYSSDPIWGKFQISDFTSDTVYSCDSYTWNGTTYTTSDVYMQTLKDHLGMDSVVMLHLYILSPSYSATYHTACDSYTWNGTTYTSSGTYAYRTKNAAGCDSTATLVLTVRKSSSSTERRTACDSYTWNGKTYTSSGTYEYHTQNAAGCDSTARLVLTVVHPTSSVTRHTACDSYTWNGTTYTSSGTYEYHTQNAAGCDSTATLVLTIRKSSSSVTRHTACDSYTWNGKTYKSSGTYTYR